MHLTLKAALVLLVAASLGRHQRRAGSSSVVGWAAATRAQRQGWQADEEPIVIKSMHSGQRHASHRPNRPGPVESSDEFTQKNSVLDQEPRSGYHQFANSIQQPSQEFESSSTSSKGSQPVSLASRSPTRLQQTDSNSFQTGQPQTLKDYYGISAAPYAQRTSASQQNQARIGGSLIRDVSELQTDILHPANQQTAGHESQWMQSMRDNHQGLVRSRLNLTSTLSSRHSDQSGSPVVPVSGVALLLDGHMRGPSSSMVPYEQQAKSVRNQPSAETALSALEPHDREAQNLDELYSLSRRNSKFTRQPNEQTTTQNTPIASVHSIPDQNTSEEMETGNGQVTLLNESELMNLDQSNDIVHQLRSGPPNKEATIILLNNNHSNVRSTESDFSNGNKSASWPSKQLNKTSRGLFANENPQDNYHPKLVESRQRELELKGPVNQSNASPAKAWSRLLPALLHRTLAGVYRRLAGNNQLHQHTSQPLKASPSLHQAIPPLAQYNSPAPGLNLLPPQTGPLSLAAQDSIDLNGMRTLASDQRLLGFRQQSLRQHANKKIIDSFIDLPVSERRSSIELQDESSRHPVSTNSTQASSIDGFPAEPRIMVQARRNSTRSRRKSKSHPEWTELESDVDYPDYTHAASMAIGPNSHLGSEQERADASELEQPVQPNRHIQELDYDPIEAADTELTDRYSSDLETAPSYESESSDSTDQLFFYAPDSSLLAPVTGEVGSVRWISQHRAPVMSKIKPIRRPQFSPIEPTAYEDPDDQVERLKRRKQNLKPQVPVPNIKDTKIASLSIRPEPTSIFLSPNISEDAAPSPSSSMMSPMSSSINVMDLHPSMTRLAHNKLIVAKFKPKRHQRPISQAHLPLRRSGDSSQSSTASGNGSGAAPTTSAKRSNSNPTLTSLTSAILGTQVISNSHINDIIGRWTRTDRSTSTAKPSIVAQQTSDNSTRSESDESSSNSLRIESGVQSLVPPVGSALSARFSLPMRSTTTTTAKPKDSIQNNSYTSLFIGTQKNDKFNFSLVHMNNRERVNPLLFPPDLMNSTGTLLNKRPVNNVRSRPSSSTTSPKPRISSTTSMSSSTTYSPTRTSQVTSSTSTSVRPMVPNELQDIGQILRSQHQTGKPMKLKTVSELERLRNQLHSLTGVNSSLDPRISGSILKTPEDTLGVTDQHLSGHITLVANDLLSTDEYASGKLDANRYMTLEDPSDSGDSSESEHSIVIMNDNHNRVRTRPLESTPFMSGRLVGSSMQYVVSEIEPTTLMPPRQTSPLNSLQIAKKYLEEFVNGTRIRPSSASKISSVDLKLQDGDSTSISAGMNSGTMSGLSQSGSTEKNSSESPILMLTNHRRPENSSESSRRSAPNGNEANKTTSTESDTASLLNKLDHKAQELLLDLFDKYPNYSDGVFAQLHKTSPTNRYKSTTVGEAFSTPKLTTSTTTTVPMTTGHASSDAEKFAERVKTHSTVELEAKPETTNTLISVPEGSKQSTTPNELSKPDTEVGARSNYDKGELQDSNNRASMRRNQAKIQEILKSFNKTTARPTTTEIRDETEESRPSYVTPTSPNPKVDEEESARVTKSSEQQETSLSYIRSSTISDFSSQSGNRYPSIEIVGAIRQKINRPSSDGSYEFTTVMAPKLRPGITREQDHFTERPGYSSTPMDINEPQPISKNKPRIPSTTEQSSEEMTNQMGELDDRYTSDDVSYAQSQPVRPIIIRRKPIRRRPSQPDRRPEGYQEDITSRPKKRRRKPTKNRPSNLPNLSELATTSLTGQQETPTGKPNDISDSNERLSEKHHDQPTIIFKPNGGAATIVRKRPSYMRLPPENIHIHEYDLKNSSAQGSRVTGIHQTSPISIILPSLDPSHIKQKVHDIRTRPLTIMDPVSDNGQALGELTPNRFGLTRLPETTIMHNKMIVPYKPGRPLPGSLFSTTAQSKRPYDDDDSLGAFSSPTPIFSTNSPSQLLPTVNSSGLPQLGSGNGGDTLLVSIEQQQANLSTRKPSSNITTDFSIEPTAQSTTPSALTSPSYQSIPNRPIIVINGLFDQSSSSSNSSYEPHKTLSHEHHHQSHNKPPRSSQSSSLLEAGSMSVVAQASHGHSDNSSRPWYPTSGTTGSRFNRTSSSVGNSTSDQSGADLSSLNQTADSVVSPDIPNFGYPSTNESSPSGSYQNHHQSQNQHIGMPYLGPGGSLPSGSRPGASRRPYRWRVKKRPNGNGSNYHDHSPSPTNSNQIFRPLTGSVHQLFSISTLVTLYDNLLIVVARLRTFLISLMVMFLPPLALAASVVNVMSS